VRVNALEKTCIRPGSKLDKKSRSSHGPGFAHSILWICMGLSTCRPFSGSKRWMCSAIGRARTRSTSSCDAVWQHCRSRKKIFGVCSVVNVDVLAGLTVCRSRFFFRPKAAHAPAPQVYKQKLVYRIVVVVNSTTHLWISRILSTTSSVYVVVNPVGYRCVCLREKMNKNPGRAKSGRSLQSVPVDMQMLIHRPGDGP
jgi:hypothetical protein